MCKTTGRIESNVKFSKRVAMEAAPGKCVRKEKLLQERVCGR
jgi:hypothetical protein